MKIAMITPEFPPNAGGIGSYVAYLSLALMARGHEVVVLVRSAEETQTMYQGIQVRRVQVRGIAPFNNAWFKSRVEAELKLIRPNLVHVHSSSMPWFRADIPIVVTSHWCIAGNTRVFYRPIRDLESLYRNLVQGIYRQVEGQLVRNCDTLTVVGRHMQRDYQDRYGVESTVVFNGVDTDLFRPAILPEREPMVIYAGMLKRGKGLLDLMDAIAHLNSRLPDTNYYVFGNGPLKSTLEKRVSSEGWSNVFLPGSVDHGYLRNMLSRASVAVLPSYYEGLPTCLLEAMACAVPVVASNAKGSSELVQDGVNGFLFRSGDAKALAESVEQILRTPDLGRAMGANGRRLVLENYSWTTVAQNVIAVYESVLDDRVQQTTPT